MFDSSYKQKTSNFLFILIVITFPISDRLFLFLRLQDFFVIIFIVLNIFLLNKLEVKFLILIILTLCATNIIGYIYFENFYLEKLAMFYKIILPIIFFFQIDKILNKKNYLIIEKYVDYTFVIFLSILFFGYEYDFAIVDLPVLPGSLTFSDQYSKDRHLISLVTCIYFGLKFIMNMKTKKNFTNFILLIIFLTMMNLFESRVFPIFLLVLFYLQLNEILKLSSNKKIWQILFYFLVIIFFIFLLKSDENSLRSFRFYEINMFKYLLDFQVIDIGPHSNRITSFFIILPENLYLLLTGIGFMHYPNPFLDSGIFFILTTFGFVPLLYLVYFINKHFKYLSNIDFSLTILLLITVLMNLVVAEFFLVSRFIFVTLIMIKISSIKSQLSFSKNINNN